MIWAVLEVYKKALSYVETNSSWHALKSTNLIESEKRESLKRYASFVWMVMVCETL